MDAQDIVLMKCDGFEKLVVMTVVEDMVVVKSKWTGEKRLVKQDDLRLIEKAKT